jgi:hypothetical protein
MEAGDFYSTTGIAPPLAYKVDGGKISITLDTRDQSPGWYLPDGPNPVLYRTRFVGKDGEILHADESATPSYTAKSSDLFVWPIVEDSNRRVAWFQPVFRS